LGWWGLERPCLEIGVRTESLGRLIGRLGVVEAGEGLFGNRSED